METHEMQWRIEEASREVRRLREQMERELGYLTKRIEKVNVSSRRAEYGLRYLSDQVEQGFAGMHELVKTQG